MFPAAREPPFITMLLAFRGVLVMSSKLYFLCQTVDVFPSYRWYSIHSYEEILKHCNPLHSDRTLSRTEGLILGRQFMKHLK